MRCSAKSDLAHASIVNADAVPKDQVALGATVQCASTGDAARSTWKPGSHQLVMIDLNGAGADFSDFYQYARSASAPAASGSSRIANGSSTSPCGGI